jgi:hypothetical protein
MLMMLSELLDGTVPSIQDILYVQVREGAGGRG